MNSIIVNTNHHLSLLFTLTSPASLDSVLPHTALILNTDTYPLLPPSIMSSATPDPQPNNPAPTHTTEAPTPSQPPNQPAVQNDPEDDDSDFDELDGAQIHPIQYLPSNPLITTRGPR
jgi:hypothetical protein